MSCEMNDDWQFNVNCLEDLCEILEEIFSPEHVKIGENVPVKIWRRSAKLGAQIVVPMSKHSYGKNELGFRVEKDNIKLIYDSDDRREVQRLRENISIRLVERQMERAGLRITEQRDVEGKIFIRAIG